MNHSDAVDKIAPALLKAQAAIEYAVEDGRGNYGTYATLTSVMEACKGPLSENAISIVQAFEPSDAGVLRLTTTLLHSSGQFISGTCTVPLVRNDPQSYGSAATYARRYSLAAMVGVCPADDDGQGAMPPANGNRQPVAARQQRPTPRAPVQRQPEQVNTTTGEVSVKDNTANTVAADPASLAEYGDLMDDERFEEAVVNELKKRNFPDQACTDAQASACRAEGVTGLGGFSLARRHQFILAIRASFFDRFRDQLKQQPKATNRPARVAAARK